MIPMSTRTNTTQHFLIEFADGEVVAEKCRNSIGGFANMAARIEAQFGTGDRMRCTDNVVAGEAADHWTIGGREFTLTEVEKG